MSAENFVPGPYFGDFGGRFVAESLMGPLEEVEAAWKRLWRDKSFQARLRDLFANYAGRPSLLTEAPRFAADLGGVRVFLKREDLNHTGSHKINNVLGQALLTKELGKTRVIAETGAGQHGVATATAAALLGLDCTIYMGREDTERQALNVARMQMLGAEVIAVTAGSATLKDAINEAFRDWVTNVETTNYIFGTAAGPHPFPELVRDLQRVIGDEARAQLLATEGRLPDVVVACVGGGSNAIGSFTAFIDDPSVELLGCEAAGDGFDTGRHAASITADQVGVLHGARTFVLQERDGQTKASHSISAGLDYPGVGPEHAWLARSGRASYIPVSDAEAMDAFLHLSRTEGIIPAIESSHALAGVRAWARAKAEAEGPFAPGDEPIAIVTVSGRGDKDVDTASRWFGYGRAKLQVIDPSAGPSGVAVDAALERGDAALIAYLPVGFPSVEDSVRAGKVLADAGVDVIELGFPYSDPGMDGPTIQRATVAALERGTHLEDLFHAVDELTSYGISTTSMTYWNPVEWWGVERFAKDFAAVGGSGLITPDLPPEEGAQWEEASDKYDLERIYLTAPSSPEHRLKLIAAHSRGWVYAASSMGVTGARAAVGAHVADVVARTRAAGAQRVCVGLGVSNGAQARQIGAYADGVIVGSALVKTLFEDDVDRGLRALSELARELKAGVSGARA